jgi:hypothetical protein
MDFGAAWDGELFAQWRIEQGHLVRTVTQPREDRILDANRELRKAPGALRPLSWAGLELSIPELHYYRLVKKYPELASRDGETKTRAWRRFLASSEADPYRVRDRSLARG